MIEETQVAVYYPGTTEVNGAAPIDLRSGGSADGIDIPVAAGPVRTRHIRGVVTEPANGQPVAQAQVLAVPRTSDPSFVIPNDQSRPDGSFDIAGVAPGSYFLFASARGLTGIVPLQVGDANVDNVAIAMTIGFQVSGRIVVEGQPRNGAAPNLSSLRIFLQRDPDILGMPSERAGRSALPRRPTARSCCRACRPATFASRSGLRAATQFFSLPEDMYVKSMRFGNADVLDGGLHVTGASRDQLEIVIGANAGRINGTVVNARRRGAGGHHGRGRAGCRRSFEKGSLQAGDERRVRTVSNPGSPARQLHPVRLRRHRRGRVAGSRSHPPV